MIGNRDHDGINIGSRQQLTEIVVSFAILVVVMFVHRLDNVVQVIFVNVAGGDNPAIRMAQKRICIVGALIAAADDTEEDLLRRRFASGGATGNQVRQNQSGAAGEEKTPAADGRTHCWSGH
jgi:hypothetical protein